MFYQLSGHPISPVKLTHKITHQNSHQVSLAELLLTFLSSPLQSKSSLQVLLYNLMVVQFSSVTQSCPTLCDPMNRSTPGLPVHHQLLDFTQTQRPSSQWCHPAISSPVIPFSSCPQSLPAWESFPMSQFFTWGGQSTRVSALASFLPKKSQGWSPLEWTDGGTHA